MRKLFMFLLLLYLSGDMAIGKAFPIRIFHRDLAIAIKSANIPWPA